VEIGKRLEECGLRLNLQKTAIVYCKDDNRREAHAHKQFTFLGYTFRPRGSRNRYGMMFQSFLPAVSLEVTKEMLRTIKSWKLSRQTPASIGELASRYNPILRGWLNYYGHFYQSALHRVFDSSEAAWRGGLVVNTRSSSGTLAAASSGSGEWHVESRKCSSIGMCMAVPAAGRWEPYDGRLSRTVLREAGGETPPAY
jgi:hypothetical protein